MSDGTRNLESASNLTDHTENTVCPWKVGPWTGIVVTDPLTDLRLSPQADLRSLSKLFF